jgi:uncharacterized lipoprotein YajG
VCGVGVVDIGFAASARWQPVEKAELTANMTAMIVLKLIAMSMSGKFMKSFFVTKLYPSNAITNTKAAIATKSAAARRLLRGSTATANAKVADMR